MDKTNGDWYGFCDKWGKNQEKNENCSYRQFLESEESGSKFQFNRSTKLSFIYYLHKYRNGLLKPSNVKRLKSRKFGLIEEKLVRYVQLHSENIKKIRVVCLGLCFRGSVWSGINRMIFYVMKISVVLQVEWIIV